MNRFRSKTSAVLLGLLSLAVAGLLMSALRAAPSAPLRGRRAESPWAPRVEDPDPPDEEAHNMVHIPAGRFLMGSTAHGFDERPVREVTLSPFLMDRQEVTYEQYRLFLEQNPGWRKGNVEINWADLNYLLDWDGTTPPKGKEEHPVVYVSWHAAQAYAEWAGMALPTEAQWEYASRGGLQNMDYPWGDVFLGHLAQWQGSGGAGPIRVGSFTINGFGIHDMAGNAGEWTADGYELYGDADESDPPANINHHLKVVRGGSWRSAEDDLRVSFRQRIPPNAAMDDLGFRCVSAR